MGLELIQYQRDAASTIADRFITYHSEPILFGRGAKQREVPFYQALSAITGAGKTAILAQAVSEIAAMLEVSPVILWLSKGKVVVQQSYANLADGGKYSHLLPETTVRLLSEYDPEDVAQSRGALLYFATVGTFNQRDREKSNLKIFAADTDNIESTRWEALKERTDAEGTRRPLIVVYDEAQNLSDQQTTLLLEQQPAVFLLASATLRFPAQFANEVIDPLRTQGEYATEDLVTAVDASTVVASGLVKGIVALDGVNAPMEETVAEMHRSMALVASAAATEHLNFSPKAIYVCNTNMVADDAGTSDDPRRPFTERQAPPIVIWRYLTEHCGVDATDVAVYANLATHRDFPLPDAFTLFGGGDSDYNDFTAGDYSHIIFNQTLQEGWDDPSVYFAYVDKSMDSTVQIAQIIGRVLRQPGARHYESDVLNTAHFYVRVDRNEAFAQVVDEVRSGLGGAAPAMRILTSPPGTEELRTFEPKSRFEIPRTGIANEDTTEPVDRILAKIHDYRGDEVNTRGAGRRRTVRQRVGSADSADSDWSAFQQVSRVNARWIVRREVSRRYRPALNVIDTDEPKFDAKIGVGSAAYLGLVDAAASAVDEYLRHAVVKQLKPNPYELGSVAVKPSSLEYFNNAVHDGYDGLNPLELQFARAIDETGLTWARNRSQTGYRIPLVTVGPTAWFFPDFLVWSGQRVLCVDTKGAHLVEADARRKLLAIRMHRELNIEIEVKFIAKGRWKVDGTPDGKDGYSLLSLGSGNALVPLPYDDLQSLVASFVEPGSTAS